MYLPILIKNYTFPLIVCSHFIVIFKSICVFIIKSAIKWLHTVNRKTQLFLRMGIIKKCPLTLRVADVTLKFESAVAPFEF